MVEQVTRNKNRYPKESKKTQTSGLNKNAGPKGYLFLQRLTGQSINMRPNPNVSPNMVVNDLINFGLEILVGGVDGNNGEVVTIGIRAPKSLNIIRKEIDDGSTVQKYSPTGEFASYKKLINRSVDKSLPLSERRRKLTELQAETDAAKATLEQLYRVGAREKGATALWKDEAKSLVEQMKRFRESVIRDIAEVKSILKDRRLLMENFKQTNKDFFIEAAMDILDEEAIEDVQYAVRQRIQKAQLT